MTPSTSEHIADCLVCQKEIRGMQAYSVVRLDGSNFRIHDRCIAKAVIEKILRRRKKKVP